MNYVIANITDEQVKKSEKYPILSMHDGMINIDVHGTMICFNAEDNDFTVCLNECLSMDIQEILEEILERIDNEVWDTLNDGGDDWFTAGKISQVKDIVGEYLQSSVYK